MTDFRTPFTGEPLVFFHGDSYPLEFRYQYIDIDGESQDFSDSDFTLEVRDPSGRESHVVLANTDLTATYTQGTTVVMLADTTSGLWTQEYRDRSYLRLTALKNGAQKTFAFNKVLVVTNI